MGLEESDLLALETLQDSLQGMPPGKFERLIASLIGRLLNVRVLVARAGFQFGGDAGTVGMQGRHLRVECKRYQTRTPLDERELCGEVDHALDRDPALEAWILAIPRTVTEQEGQALNNKGEKVGLPIIILDWELSGSPRLAALCTAAPDLVEDYLGQEMGEIASNLASPLSEGLQQLSREFETWNLGFERLRRTSHARLESIWTVRREAVAAIGQNVAGGATDRTISRLGLEGGLDDWWNGPAKGDAPAVLLGDEGTGKTWAAFGWLKARLTTLPLVLVISASSLDDQDLLSPISIKRVLARQISEWTGGVHSLDHWFMRVERLLKRPPEEGPVFLIYIDGLNQASAVPWLSCLKALQAPPFEGLVKVMVSNRPMHFREKLHELRGLVVPSVVIPVGDYSEAELQQKLGLEGLVSVALSPSMCALARRPRLFDLVIRLRSSLASPGELTPDRLLWEYGRDEQGNRDRRSFSEAEWHEWLRELAQRFQIEPGPVSRRELAEMTSRADLSAQEVFARLSDVIDGRITKVDARGQHRFNPAVVAHALGLVLLENLRAAGSSLEDLLEAIEQWLDPLTGLDQRSDILRAATSILLAQAQDPPGPMAGALVTAWLQSQNLADEHRVELQGLAPRLVGPLLDSVERSKRSNQAQARIWAIQALRSLPHEAGPVLDAIIDRSCEWLSTGFRGLFPAEPTYMEADSKRAERFIERIGIDASGEVRILGVLLKLVDGHPDELAMAVPSLLEGFPLAGASRLFETAAANVSACGRLPVWRELEWLCLLNPIDAEETAHVLQTMAEDVQARMPECGLNPDMPRRMAANILWLIGTESADREAKRINPSFGGSHFDYYEDYLLNPARSLLGVERRHAEMVLLDAGLACAYRIDRVQKWWVDPTFEAPKAFLEELGSQLDTLDLKNVESGLWRTAEDHMFEKVIPVLARYFPQELAMNILKLFHQAIDAPRETQLQRAIKSVDHFLLTGMEEAQTAKALRTLLGPAQVQVNLLHISRLIVAEIQGMAAYKQREVILSAGLPAVISEISDVLTPLSVLEAESCLEACSGQQQLRNCIVTMIDTEVGTSEVLRTRLKEIAFSNDTDCHGVSLYILNRNGGQIWEQDLWKSGWSASRKADQWTNHFGSLALIRGGKEASFQELAQRIAPWLLPYAVRYRGENPSEIHFAIQQMELAINGFIGQVPDLGALLTIHTPHGPSERMHFSTEPNEESDQGGSTSFNPDLHLQRHRRAHLTAIERLRQVASEGADLFLASVAPGDLIPMVGHGKAEILIWLEGMENMTEAFCRRIRLAEGVFLALCEALLEMDPPLGARLWKALQSALAMRHCGITGLDERLLILFRVPESPEVLNLREQLLAPGVAQTDLDLFNVVLAASLCGCEVWLNERIRVDMASEAGWQRRRGLVLNGLTSENPTEQPDAWTVGPCDSSEAIGRRLAGRRRYYEGCARRWWGQYLAATGTAEAFAAWRLFLACVDRRAWRYVTIQIPERHGYQELDRKKKLHLELNLQTLTSQMEEHEKGLKKSFLWEEPPTTLGAWGGLAEYEIEGQR